VKLEWLLIAEGFGRDAKQAITAIGINQNVQIAQSLPVVTKRGVFAHLTDEEGRLKEGDTISVSLQVKSPSGRTIIGQTSEGPVGPPPWPDLPVGVDIVAEVGLRLPEFGRYSFELTLTHVDSVGSAKSVESEVVFHVKESAALLPEPS
jgi:hypothetical protein